MTETEARAILKKQFNYVEGDRLDYWPSMNDRAQWTPGQDTIEIEGEFTVDQLLAIAWYVRHRMLDDAR